MPKRDIYAIAYGLTSLIFIGLVKYNINFIHNNFNKPYRNNEWLLQVIDGQSVRGFSMVKAVSEMAHADYEINYKFLQGVVERTLHDFRSGHQDFIRHITSLFREVIPQNLINLGINCALPILIWK